MAKYRALVDWKGSINLSLSKLLQKSTNNNTGSYPVTKFNT